MKTRTLISWNVNGLRAVARKGFLNWLAQNDYGAVALQETKLADPKILPLELSRPAGYHTYWHSAARPGYSGVAVYTKDEPVAVKTSFDSEILSAEGRLIELDFGEFIFLNVYFPNGKASPERLEYKLEFYEAFLIYLKSQITNGRKIIFCGDVNTAHREIDLARPKENRKISGFLPTECDWIDRVIATGFVDTFRLFHSESDQYTWWDQKTRARERNVGWRIDYFFVSANLHAAVMDAFTLPAVEGSDHCPVGLTLKL
ncbi:MAG: exodeoxyribonuclease III [Patescibacteria group bacterium]